MKKLLLNYIIYFSFFIFICIIGISNVFGANLQGWAKNVNLYTDVNLISCSSSTCSNVVSLTADYFYDSESLVKYNNFISASHNITNNGDMILNYHRYLPGYLYSSTSYVCFSGNVTLTNSQIDLYVGSYSDTVNKVGNLSYHNVLVQTLDNHPYSPGDQYNKCYAIVNLFSPSVEGQNIGKVYKATSTISSRTYLIGEEFQSLGIYSGSLNNTINSAITNSGLATSNSIEELQDNLLEVQEEIISNQNLNTQQQIESQKVCQSKILTYSDTISPGYLNSSGVVTSQSTWGITDYLMIDKLVINQIAAGAGSVYSCFYNENKQLISCIPVTTSTGNYNLPAGTKYARFSIRINDIPIYNASICKNGNQAIADTQQDINNTLNNSDVDSSDDTLTNLQDNLPTNNVISSLLLLPVRLLQALVNSLGGTCSTFSLGSLMGTNLVMPCINLQNYLGSTIWTFIDLVFSGMFILVIRKKFIQIFENITNLKGGGNEVD